MAICGFAVAAPSWSCPDRISGTGWRLNDIRLIAHALGDLGESEDIGAEPAAFLEYEPLILSAKDTLGRLGGRGVAGFHIVSRRAQLRALLLSITHSSKRERRDPSCGTRSEAPGILRWPP